MPAVVGRTPQEAAETLSTVGLALGDTTPVEANGSRGMILSQEPEAGDSVKPGTSVAVEVSVARRKIEPVAVPDLLGRRLEEARSLLAARKFSLGGVRYDVLQGADSTVYWQSPPRGARRPAGTAVTVRIAVPTPAVAVPNVVGLDSAHAHRVLADSGFRLGVMGSQPSDSQPGTVLSQSPGAGAPSATGTLVSVLFAKRGDLPIPNVIAMRAAAAESAIAGVGLAVRSDTQIAFGDHGVVTAQSPAGGAVATPGLVVELTVGRWPTAWSWVIGIVGSLAAIAASWGPIRRRVRDWRWRRRLTPVPVTASGAHTLQQPAEPLLGPDLQLQPISSPAVSSLKVDGPLFAEDS